MLGARAVYCKTDKIPATADIRASRCLTRWRLFHGHTLGEIAWFIDIAAQLNCKVIGEKLKRDDRQYGHHVLRRFRQHDYVVGDFFEVLCAVSTSYRDNRPFAGFYLLHVIQV